VPYGHPWRKHAAISLHENAGGALDVAITFHAGGIVGPAGMTTMITINSRELNYLAALTAPAAPWRRVRLRESIGAFLNDRPLTVGFAAGDAPGVARLTEHALGRRIGATRDNRRPGDDRRPR
jgi:hypothetical protein